MTKDENTAVTRHMRTCVHATTGGGRTKAVYAGRWGWKGSAASQIVPRPEGPSPTLHDSLQGAPRPTCASIVSRGVPSSLVMIQSAPPVDVMPWATMKRTAAGQQVAGWARSDVCAHATLAQVFSLLASLQRSGPRCALPPLLTNDGHQPRGGEACEGRPDGNDLEDDLPRRNTRRCSVEQCTNTGGQAGRQPADGSRLTAKQPAHINLNICT